MILAMIGDVMLGRGVAVEIKGRTPQSFWGDVLPLLHSADLVITGLECAMTTHPQPWSRSPKVFHFKAPPEAVEVLRAAGVRVVSLANNHTLDFEEQGLLDTIRYLDEAGIAHAGAGSNMAQARRPALVQAGGLRIGVLSFTDNEPGWCSGPDSPGTNYIEIKTDAATLQLVEDGVAQARAGGAQIIILSLHWEPNMRLRPAPDFRQFARAAVARGVDVIYGHSAHIFQGIEIHQGRPILYDTGDFLDDYAVDPKLRNDQSLLFLAEMDAAGVRELRLVPVRLRYAVVNKAVGQDVEEICTRMRDLCAEMGTHIERTDSILRVNIRPQA